MNQFEVIDDKNTLPKLVMWRVVTSIVMMVASFAALCFLTDWRVALAVLGMVWSARITWV